MTRDARDIPAVLANRFKLSKHTALLAILSEAMKHERTAATLRNGMVNLIAMARETESAIAEDLSDVA